MHSIQSIVLVRSFVVANVDATQKAPSARLGLSLCAEEFARDDLRSRCAVPSASPEPKGRRDTKTARVKTSPCGRRGLTTPEEQSRKPVPAQQVYSGQRAASRCCITPASRSIRDDFGKTGADHQSEESQALDLQDDQLSRIDRFCYVVSG